MLVIDASSLYEVLTEGIHASAVRAAMAADDEHAAPHLVDAEVVSIIRRDYMLGALDLTAAEMAIIGLHEWRGERFGHDLLLDRVWELRNNVRSWDAFYVALAEVLDATLITVDQRLAGATGVRCTIETARADLG
jgi:predicted nucleic acid-binding protein